MIRTPLMEHQRKVVDFVCKDRKEYAGIFSDYGTGKSLCALQIIEEMGFKRVLVVSTSLAIETTWVDEIKKHTDFVYCLLRGTSKQKINTLRYALMYSDTKTRYAPDLSSIRPTVFLINYEGIKSVFFELQAVKFDAIFADESTKIKTFNSKRTLALFEVGKTASHRYIMTGFPVTEALSELYSQVKFLSLGITFGNSYYAFLNKYFVRHGMKIVPKKKAVSEILDAIKPFCIRITNDMLRLPPKSYKVVHVHPTDKQRELLVQLNNTFRLEFGNVKIDTKFLFTLLSKSLQICDGFIQSSDDGEDTVNLEVLDTAKDEALLETLEEIDIKKNKVVIWCAFLFSIRKIKHMLAKLGYDVLSLTGESEDTNKTVQMFQRSSKHNVLLCTQKKAAESVTLTAARYAIYYSNTWSNDLRLNSEARIRRKGSERHSSIIYIDLLTKGTVEEKVYECLRKKKNLIDTLKEAFLDINRR